jgi:hypothetical protein
LNYDSKVIPRLKFAAACIFLVLGAFAFPFSAQQPKGVTSEPFSPAPYRLGERLTYNVSFSSFVSAAHVEVLVAGRGIFFGRDGIQLKGHVETTGVVSAALLAIDDDYIAYVDPATGESYRGQQISHEGSRATEKTTEYPGAYDFLSAIYRVRALPLREGSTYEITVRGDGVIYQIQVKSSGHQTVKTNVGSFNTIVSQIRVRNGANDHRIKIYFSDDERHIPVLATAKLSPGEIRAELAGSDFITTAPVVQAPIATPTPQPTPMATPRQPPPVVIGPRPVVSPTPRVSDERSLEDLPFKVGEQLTYRVFIPATAEAVGIATFQVRGHSKYFDHDGLLLTVNAQTTNALAKVFIANDIISSYVDPQTLLPFHTEFSFSEGRRRFSGKLAINQDYGTATSEKGERIEIPVGTHDYLSFFYMLRTLRLTPPKGNAVSILVNNKPKTLFINAVKREQLQLGSQTIPAIQISLTTDDPQGDKFQLRAWISDDKRRLPLRLTAVTQLGQIRADLAIIPVSNQ